MTIATQQASITIEGDGANTTFGFDFLIPYQADGSTPAVLAFTTDADGNTTMLVLGVDFSIAGVGVSAGGMVTYPISGTALPLGETITILRALEYVQPDEFEDQSFRASQVEAMGDTIVMELQQVETDVQGSVRGQPGELLSRLPSAPVRALKTILFDSLGNPGVSPLDIIVSSSNLQFGTVALAAAATIPLSATFLWVAGFYTPGDGGQGFYVPTVSAVALGIFQSVNQRWALVTADGATNVKALGMKGDNTFDNTTIWNAAVVKKNGEGGGILFFPRGLYRTTAVIAILPKVIFQGEGRTISLLSADHTGDGMKFTGTVNVQNIANYGFRDFGMTCANGSNTGGGLVDESGTFVWGIGFYVNGFKYGIICDQSEVFHFDLIQIQSQLTRSIWVVNGPERRGTAFYFFTNMVSFTKAQLDEGLVAAADIVVDNGGYAHHYELINFNGGRKQLRLAGVSGGSVRGGEWEGNNTTAIVTLSNLTDTGDGVGAPVGVRIGENLMVQSTGLEVVNVIAASGLSVEENYMTTTGAVVKIKNLQNAQGAINIEPNVVNTGALFDGNAFNQVQTLTNGTNNNVAFTAYIGPATANVFMPIGGPSGAFTTTGFVREYGGRTVTLYNGTGGAWTIAHASGSSSAVNRIFTPTGADLTNVTTATFTYNNFTTSWIVVSYT